MHQQHFELKTFNRFSEIAFNRRVIVQGGDSEIEQGETEEKYKCSQVFCSCYGLRLKSTEAEEDNAR